MAQSNRIGVVFILRTRPPEVLAWKTAELSAASGHFGGG